LILQNKLSEDQDESHETIIHKIIFGNYYANMTETNLLKHTEQSLNIKLQKYDEMLSCAPIGLCPK